jgi:DNA repair protein RecO (recombination protein O)
MQRVTQQPGFVLHQRNYSETSLLLDLFTRDYGRIGVIARGARRTKRGGRSALGPFQPLLLSWSGRGELGVLTDSEPGDGCYALAGDGLFCGFYLNELLTRLLHRHDPHEALFEAYQRCLNALAQDRDFDRSLRVFESVLLQEIGYGLVLDHDTVDNSPIDPDAVYDYLPDAGPRRLYPPEAAVAGVRVRGRSLLGLAAGQLDDRECLQDAKRLMRALLARCLGDKPLHSRRLFEALAGRSRVKQLQGEQE